jgi:arginase
MGDRVVKVDLIAVPWDSGARGVRMGAGPEHLLEIGIVEALERSGADVSVHMVEPDTSVFGGEIKIAFEIQRLVAERVAHALSRERFPIVLSGNCNTAVGTVAGMTRSSGSPPAVCWLDAHGDFNTPDTTPSGFLDGMAVAMLAGRCWNGMTSKIPGFVPVPENQIVMTGLRALDSLEEENIEKSEVKRAPIADAVSAIESTGRQELYLHVDLDVFDTSVGSANGYAVSGGFSREDFMRFAADARGRMSIGACALTAYDPAYDADNRIGRLAVDIARGLATGQGLV